MPKPSPRPLLLALTLAAPWLALTPAVAVAQVTVDLHALDAPPAAPVPPQAAAPGHHAVPHTPPPHHTVSRPAEKTPEKTTGKPSPTEQATKPAERGAPAPPAPPTGSATSAAPTAPKPAPPAPVIGVAPPPVPVIPPPVAADAPMAPEPPPPISDTAGTTVAPLPTKSGDGVRLDFASGEADLTPGTVDAVKALVAAAPKADTTTFNVMAYATGVPEDPSTARRLSLSRAMSVRSALMAYGVPSTHIYVRAMGAQAGEGPSDRVDVLVMGANGAAAPVGTAPGAQPHRPTATP